MCAGMLIFAKISYVMKLRTVAKLGVIVSILLFCLGVGGYGFLQLSLAREGKNVDLLEFVPDDCVGFLETDNFAYVVNELPQTGYAHHMAALGKTGLLTVVSRHFDRMNEDGGAHGLSNCMNQMMVSFHEPLEPDNVIVYFRMSGNGKSLLQQLAAGMEEQMGSSKKETYRGKTIDVYPVSNGRYVAAYCGNGFLVLSYQKRLVERAIDAGKDGTSLACNPLLKGKLVPDKSANYLTLFGRTSSLPLLEEGHCHNWCEFDIHMNSEVFYMSGSMLVPDSCFQQMEMRLGNVPSVLEDSVLIVSGAQQVDACITEAISRPQHTLFDECVSNLSRDAAFIMVADLEKVAQEPRRFENYLPPFLLERVEQLRSFILSVQLTKVDNQLSHIFVFTYKD